MKKKIILAITLICINLTNCFAMNEEKNNNLDAENIFTEIKNKTSTNILKYKDINEKAKSTILNLYKYTIETLENINKKTAKEIDLNPENEDEIYEKKQKYNNLLISKINCVAVSKMVKILANKIKNDFNLINDKNFQKYEEKLKNLENQTKEQISNLKKFNLDFCGEYVKENMNIYENLITKMKNMPLEDKVTGSKLQNFIPDLIQLLYDFEIKTKYDDDKQDFVIYSYLDSLDLTQEEKKIVKSLLIKLLKHLRCIGKDYFKEILEFMKLYENKSEQNLSEQGLVDHLNNIIYNPKDSSNKNTNISKEDNEKIQTLKYIANQCLIFLLHNQLKLLNFYVKSDDNSKKINYNLNKNLEIIPNDFSFEPSYSSLDTRIINPDGTPDHLVIEAVNTFSYINLLCGKISSILNKNNKEIPFPKLEFDDQTEKKLAISCLTDNTLFFREHAHISWEKPTKYFTINFIENFIEELKKKEKNPYKKIVKVKKELDEKILLCKMTGKIYNDDIPKLESNLDYIEKPYKNTLQDIMSKILQICVSYLFNSNSNKISDAPKEVKYAFKQIFNNSLKQLVDYQKAVELLYEHACDILDRKLEDQMPKVQTGKFIFSIDKRNEIKESYKQMFKPLDDFLSFGEKMVEIVREIKKFAEKNEMIHDKTTLANLDKKLAMKLNQMKNILQTYKNYIDGNNKIKENEIKENEIKENEDNSTELTKEQKNKEHLFKMQKEKLLDLYSNMINLLNKCNKKTHEENNLFNLKNIGELTQKKYNDLMIPRKNSVLISKIVKSIANKIKIDINNIDNKFNLKKCNPLMSRENKFKNLENQIENEISILENLNVDFSDEFKKENINIYENLFAKIKSMPLDDELKGTRLENFIPNILQLFYDIYIKSKYSADQEKLIIYNYLCDLNLTLKEKDKIKPLLIKLLKHLRNVKENQIKDVLELMNLYEKKSEKDLSGQELINYINNIIYNPENNSNKNADFSEEKKEKIKILNYIARECLIYLILPKLELLIDCILNDYINKNNDKFEKNNYDFEKISEYVKNNFNDTPQAQSDEFKINEDGTLDDMTIEEINTSSYQDMLDGKILTILNKENEKSHFPNTEFDDNLEQNSANMYIMGNIHPLKEDKKGELFTYNNIRNYNIQFIQDLLNELTNEYKANKNTSDEQDVARYINPILKHKLQNRICDILRSYLFCFFNLESDEISLDKINNYLKQIFNPELRKFIDQQKIIEELYNSAYNFLKNKLEYRIITLQREKNRFYVDKREEVKELYKRIIQNQDKFLSYSETIVKLVKSIRQIAEQNLSSTNKQNLDKLDKKLEQKLNQIKNASQQYKNIINESNEIEENKNNSNAALNPININNKDIVPYNEISSININKPINNEDISQNQIIDNTSQIINNKNTPQNQILDNNNQIINNSINLNKPNTIINNKK